MFPRLALGALLQLTAEADFWHPTAPLHEPGEAIDLTARIKRRQAVQGLINEHRRAA
jgi:hypothetical protein